MSAATEARLEANAYADRFPMLGADELDRLAQDIAENGLVQPIVLDSSGRVLDGRNRLAACERAGVTPTFTTFDGVDEASFVLSANVARRHLTTGQQAAATALILGDAGRRRSGRWARGSVDIGDSSNIDGWRAAMKQAGYVLDHAPDLLPDVAAGTLALDAAYQQTKQAQAVAEAEAAKAAKEAQEEAEARELVIERAPDLAARVDGVDLDNFRQAAFMWRDRNREEAARLRAEKAAADKREREERAARGDLYGAIAKAVLVLDAYGRYPSAANVMAEYTPTELSPTMLADAFDAEKLASARRFLEGLTEWSKP